MMMKLFSMTLLLLSFLAQAQNDKYEAAILRGKELLSDAEDKDAFLAASNYFERIAKKEAAQWIPLYYQAQSMAFAATTLSDKAEKETLLNDALEVLQRAKQLEKNAELATLEGFVQMLRLTVDPATRGQTLSPTIFGLYNEALALEPDNPRALLFLGQMEYGTAQFFGKGFEEACAHIQQAYDIFEQQPGEPTTAPDWGAQAANTSLELCNQMSVAE